MMHDNEDRSAVEKDLKVRLPAAQHVKLHSVKVLTGQSLSETVRLALDAHFARLEAEERAGLGQRSLRNWQAR
ncbi:MAG: hypothetical protein LC624_00535 [Halobacteriales archaeon]|nr:hypothetical protein [Halobacteriales archaeon]